MKNDFMLLLAKMAPRDVLIEMLEEAIKTYKDIPSGKNFTELAALCMMISTNKAMEGKEVSDVSREIHELDRIRERLNNNKTVQQ